MDLAHGRLIFRDRSRLLFQTAFLSGPRPCAGPMSVTNLFEVSFFSPGGRADLSADRTRFNRLSLMGAFTAPFCLCAANVSPCHGQSMCRILRVCRQPLAGISRLDLDDRLWRFALACVAGVMYLVQERHTQDAQIHSGYRLPPLTNLFAAITRLLWLGLGL